MTIGIDIRMLGRKRTGDETVFFNLVKNVARIDTTNTYILFLDTRTPAEILAIAQSLGVTEQKNICLLSLPTKSKFLWNAWTLPLYLRKHPVDIYHTQYIVPFFLSRAIRVVTHIHDVSFCAYPKYIAWKDRFFLRLLIPRSLRRADAVVAVSEYTKQEIVRYYGIEKEKIEVIYNAVSDDFAQPVKVSLDRIETVRTRYDLPENFILYIGTLQPRKNIPNLIRAFSLAQKKLSKGTYLVIVGNRSGYHYDTAIDMALNETSIIKSVLFPGFIDQADLPVVMSLAKVFVFPSLYEGFGVPILEAFSQGIPVIAADIPPLCEVAQEAALFVNPLDLAKFAETLYTALTATETRLRLQTAGFRRCQDFSWSVSAQRLLRLYERLV